MNSNYLEIKEVILVLFFSVFIFGLNSVGTFDSVRSIFSVGFEDFYVETKNYLDGINNYIFVFENVGDVRDENEDLRARVVELESEVSELNVQLKDVSFIIEQGINDFDNDAELIPVRVLHYDREDSGVVYINKGSNDSVDDDDVVVLGRFAIGLVEQVYPAYSKVELILSDDFQVNAISLQNATKGIFGGSLPDSFEVQEIINDAALSPGDIFVTEGIDGLFPYGFYLGRVERSIGNPANPTKVATLVNNLDFRSLDRLYVMKYK